MNYKIIGTGSTGNAVLIGDSILVDCGLPYKSIKSVEGQIKVVLLTHIHGDHFNPVAISRLASNRPSVRFACGEWLVVPLIQAGVFPSNIDILQGGKTYSYAGIADVTPCELNHNVPNFGYKIIFPDGKKVFYATDTNDLNGIDAKGYDLYMIEADFGEEEIKKRIKDKDIRGEYAYEREALKNHLSVDKCNDFIYRNAESNSEYVYMHQHKEREET